MSAASVPLARTVLGDVPASDLGAFLPHEHVLCDTRTIWGLNMEGEPVTPENAAEVSKNPMAYPDCLVLDDVELATAELRDFKANGGGGIADLTPEGVGGNPAALVHVSRGSGLHVITGFGPYVEHAQLPKMRDISVEALADDFVRNIVEGIDGTGVRAGIIGEIGTSEPIGPGETKALKAAAIAQQATGCAITIHVHMGARTGHQILSIIEDAGGDPSRVVLGHLDVHLSRDFEPDTAVQHHVEVADRGCFIEYDLCGFEEFVRLSTGPSYHHATDLARVEAVHDSVERAYGSHLLLSHDVCKKVQLKHFGGRGYSHTVTTFKEMLVERGLSPEMLTEIYEVNPQRVFAMQTV